VSDVTFDAASRRFYDEFMQRRMLQYRLSPNLRLERAARFVLSHARPGMRVLDVGCGIGVVSEAVARRVAPGRVVACDLGEANVWYARRSVPLGNVEFHLADAIRDFPAIERRLDAPVDLITMIDVIEHLPGDGKAALLANLGRVAAPSATLCLTFPTPEYQQWLRAHDPAELQPIDDDIEVADLARMAAAGGWRTTSFRYVDVWRRNQYVQAVLARGVACPPSEGRGALPVGEALAYRLKRLAWSVTRPLRRRRYVDAVFGRVAGP